MSVSAARGRPTPKSYVAILSGNHGFLFVFNKDVYRHFEPCVTYLSMFSMGRYGEMLTGYRYHSANIPVITIGMTITELVKQLTSPIDEFTATIS